MHDAFLSAELALISKFAYAMYLHRPQPLIRPCLGVPTLLLSQLALPTLEGRGRGG